MAKPYQKLGSIMKSSIYARWIMMKQRCLNPRNRSYPNYGGRGISICERWKNSFSAFEEDMGPIPEGCSIERINNDGPYSPDNCRWATASEQQRNRRCLRLEFKGQRRTVREIAEMVGLDPKRLSSRIHRGIRLSVAASYPPEIANLPENERQTMIQARKLRSRETPEEKRIRIDAEKFARQQRWLAEVKAVARRNP